MNTTENIYIVTPKGDQLTIAFDPTDTIEQLSAKVEAADGTPACDQKFAFGGKLLEDGHALSEYNITKEAQLDLGVRVEGGFWWVALILHFL